MTRQSGELFGVVVGLGVVAFVLVCTMLGPAQIGFIITEYFKGYWDLLTWGLF